MAANSFVPGRLLFALCGLLTATVRAEADHAPSRSGTHARMNFVEWSTVGLIRDEPLAVQVFKLRFVAAADAVRVLSEYEPSSVEVIYQVVGPDRVLVIARKGSSDRFARRVSAIDVPGPYRPAPRKHFKPAKPAPTPGITV